MIFTWSFYHLGFGSWFPVWDTFRVWFSASGRLEHREWWKRRSLRTVEQCAKVGLVLQAFFLFQLPRNKWRKLPLQIYSPNRPLSFHRLLPHLPLFAVDNQQSWKSINFKNSETKSNLPALSGILKQWALYNLRQWTNIGLKVSHIETGKCRLGITTHCALSNCPHYSRDHIWSYCNLKPICNNGKNCNKSENWIPNSDTFYSERKLFKFDKNANLRSKTGKKAEKFDIFKNRKFCWKSRF